MERDGFIFYRSFYEAIACLDATSQLSLFHAICQYGLDGTEPALTGIADGMFRLVKPQLEANNKRYMNGQRGGAPRGNQNARKNNQETTEKQPKNNQKQPKEKEKEKEKAKEKERISRFKPPTLEEVQTYVRENKYNVDAERFIDYYESNGWRVGKNPMKDWKAAVRNWNRKTDLNKTEQTRTSKHVPSYDPDLFQQKAREPIQYKRKGADS